MNIHLAVSSQVPNQKKVNEIQKDPPSFSAPLHRFLKGLGERNSNFIPNNASINRPLYKYPKKS